MQEGVSIIICCYNSERRIRETLRHLAAQQQLSFPAELLLIDNACTDRTVAVAQDCWQELGSPVPLHVHREERPGLTHARMCGIDAARYSITLFCDDDNHLAPLYLCTAYHFMQSHPEVGACFGHSEAIYEETPPSWIHGLEEAFAVGPAGLAEGEIEPPRTPWGAGLLMPTAFLKKMQAGEQGSYLSDRTGKSLSSGGDTEFCYRARAEGYKWYYNPALRFGHVIPAGRTGKTYLRSLFAKFGEAEARIDRYYRERPGRPVNFNISRYILKERFLLKAAALLPQSDASFHKELARIRKLGYYSEWLKISGNERTAH
ncbi:MAG: glycosyltransferase [Flavobacteriales bacterium]